MCQLRASTKAGQVTKWYKIEIQMAGAPNLLLRLWTSSPTEKSMVWKIVNNNNEVPQRFLLTKSPMLGCCGSKKIQQIFMVCIQRWTSKKTLVGSSSYRSENFKPFVPKFVTHFPEVLNDHWKTFKTHPFITTQKLITKFSIHQADVTICTLTPAF